MASSQISRSAARLRSWLFEYRWWGLAACALATLAIGMLGFAAVPQPGPDRRSFDDLLYLALQLFVVESGAVPPPVPRSLDVARLVAPALTALATAGLVTKLITELRAVTGRSARQRTGHVIICGLGKKGKRLARGFSQDGKVVAIDTAGGSGLRSWGFAWSDPPA